MRLLLRKIKPNLLIIQKYVSVVGFQTLGEEYVNIVQVDSSQRQVPSAYVSASMIT